MPQKVTVKNRSGKRVFKIPSVSVPFVQLRNLKKNITYKVPINLLEPKNLLRATQKNKANVIRAANAVRQQRLAAQARFADMLRAERARQATRQNQPALLKAFENNNADLMPTHRVRGPGARGAIRLLGTSPIAAVGPRSIPPNLLRMMHGLKAPQPAPYVPPEAVLKNAAPTKTVRKANLLKMQRAAAKAKKPTGKFWNANENSSSNENNEPKGPSATGAGAGAGSSNPNPTRHVNLPFYNLE